MFGPLGGGELLLILILALLLFGPRKLPQIGKTLGRAMAELRGATHEFKSSLEREVRIEELQDAKKDLGSVEREIKDAVSDATSGSVPRTSDGQKATES